MLAKPFIENTKKVVATGAAIRISNSCEFRTVCYTSPIILIIFLPVFKIRIHPILLFGRMAWSNNGLLLVSGGLGMFDKETVIEAGYWHQSLGEDIELITRIRKLMHKKRGLLIIYIPESLCWTEVPNTLEMFLDNVRWARGLVQTLYLHKIFFKIWKTGLLVFLHTLFFYEFCTCFEVIGIIVLIFFCFSI
jgi:cellulose synthase/poly-beta-1,6-N-acetylglucosamine synthase-like glycosyltransferase